MIDEGDCGAIGGMKIGRGNRSTRRKPAPASFCPPQIPLDRRPKLVLLTFLFHLRSWMLSGSNDRNSEELRNICKFCSKTI
jgi:hypothetical protein